MFNSVCLKCSNKNEKRRSATTNFGKEEVLKIIIMITITFWTSGDIDPIKLSNLRFRNPICEIPGAQTCQLEQCLCKMLKIEKEYAKRHD